MVPTRRLALCRSAVLRGIFCFAFAVWIIGCNKGGSGGAGGTGPGEQTPDIQGVDLTGKPTTLRSQLGKVTLLNFWATWCAPCVNELPALEATYKQLKDKGFTVVGVAIDDTLEEVQGYQKKFSLSYPIILDADGVSKRHYDLRGVPESFVLDASGKVIMIMDPTDGSPVSRLTGPREWESTQVIDILRKLLS